MYFGHLLMPVYVQRHLNFNLILSPVGNFGSGRVQR